MSLPAGTSPGKAGENKNIGVRGEEKKKKKTPMVFYWQASFRMELGSAWWGKAVLSLHGNVGAAVCPSKGSWLLGLFLLVGGISLPFNLVFTANSAKAFCKQQVTHSGLFGTAPMG